MHPTTHDVYIALTDNDRRGADGQTGPDPANPRAQCLRPHPEMARAGRNPAATKFRCDVFTVAGEEKGFGSLDGLWFDSRGLLWIQTDVSTSVLNRGPYAKIGNNQMLAADITTGEIRRFLTGSVGCEVTGAAMTPDGRSLFVNIQHPGEPASERSDSAAPRAIFNWPDFRPDGRPRAATLVIRREDRGLIGL